MKKRIYYQAISGKKYEKKTLNTFILLENNQSEPQCLAERKKKHPLSYLN